MTSVKHTDAKSKQAIGRKGEDVVVALLKEKSFVIIARNVFTRWGELDIIATKNNITHVIEVKTRTSDVYGGPESALSRSKFKKMQRTVTILSNNSQFSVGGFMDFDFAAVLLTYNNAKVTFYWNIGEADF